MRHRNNEQGRQLTEINTKSFEYLIITSIFILLREWNVVVNKNGKRNSRFINILF